MLKAGIRYGRSSTHKHIHKSLPAAVANQITVPPFIAQYYGVPTTMPCPVFKSHFQGIDITCPKAAYNHEFVDSQSSQSETHAMIDFTLGKDVGIGTVGGGVRIAQFTTNTSAELNMDPHYNFPPTIHVFTGGQAQKYGEIYDGTTQEHRSFHGVGPEITWDASQSVLGDEDNGQVSIDWGVNAAVLFGQQRVKIHRNVAKEKCQGNGGFFGACTYIYNTPTNVSRSNSVAVPNLGGYVGASVRYSNAKINFGYRVDEFFGAMDGGQDTAKKYNRGFYGPYLNISLGLGG